MARNDCVQFSPIFSRRLYPTVSCWTNLRRPCCNWRCDLSC